MKYTDIPAAGRDIAEIIVHCSGTPAGRDVHVADVDAWHRRRGFDGIGYHYVVTLDGKVEAGRPVERVGAHCLGHNRRSIGVCYVGGVLADGKTPADTRTEAQKLALRRLLIKLLKKHRGAGVFGHRNFAATACPGFNAFAEYRTLNP